MEYGVVVNNKFALFDNEDEDPLEVLQRTEEEAARKSKTAAKENTAGSKSKIAAKNAKNASKTATKTETKQPAKVLAPAQEQKTKAPAQNLPPRRDNVSEKPPRFRQSDNAPRRPPHDDNREQHPKIDSDFRPERTEPRGDDYRGAQRRGRGGQGGRGGINDGGFDRFGKREFERHSGSDRTGLKPVEKREGGGAHNWGTIADAVAEQEQLAANPTLADQSIDAGTTTNEEQPVAGEDVGVEEDEKQMTLDEWKAMQQRERAKPAFNIRKPGEGVQTAPEWKKMVVYKKKVNEEGQEEDDEEDEEDEEDDHNRQKQTIPIQIRFNDSSSSRGGGGGRRGGRGRGGQGGGRGGGRQSDGADRPPRRNDKAADVVPNVDNEFDFPSLG